VRMVNRLLLCRRQPYVRDRTTWRRIGQSASPFSFLREGRQRWSDTKALGSIAVGPYYCRTAQCGQSDGSRLSEGGSLVRTLLAESSRSYLRLQTFPKLNARALFDDDSGQGARSLPIARESRIPRVCWADLYLVRW